MSTLRILATVFGTYSSVRTELTRFRSLCEQYVYPIAPLTEILSVVKICQDLRRTANLVVDDYLAREVFVSKNYGFAVMNLPPFAKLGEVNSVFGGIKILSHLGIE
jgi:hypothetical protein